VTKRLALLIVSTGAIAALVVILRPRESTPPPPPAAIGSPTATAPVSPATSPSPSRPPHYRAGSVVTSEMTDYGLVRVRVTVARGEITAAHAIAIPDHVPLDVQLSRPAVTELEAAVLAAQSADVDMVSGATFTSTGYLASVQAALDQLS
jgi:uncharacterized protein with FMN-binding domain